MSELQTIKTLMNQYNEAYKASRESDKIKKKLIPLLKSNNLTETKLNFNDRAIYFHTYTRKEEISQKLIKNVLIQKYPNVNPEKFIEDLCNERKKITTETLGKSEKNQKNNYVTI